MTLDDAATGDDQPCRLHVQATQATGGFAHEHALVAGRGPSHVPESLHRMHSANLLA